MAKIVGRYKPNKRGLRIYFSLDGADKPGYDLLMNIRRAIESTLDYEKIIRDCEVSVTLCDTEAIHRLNLEYRGIDRPTDVLSFPLNEDIETAADELPEIPLGDIVLCIDKAKEQAAELGHSFIREAAFLAIHSTLHLLGYDHERSSADDEDMCKRQREIIEKLGLE